MERFAIIVNSFQPLTIVTKRFMVVAAVQNPRLSHHIMPIKKRKVFVSKVKQKVSLLLGNMD